MSNTQRTLSLIKPDATKRNITGAINAMIEKEGLKIVAQIMVQLTKEQAEKFYEVHAERGFYKDLCDFMVTGPIVAQILEGENAVERYRNLMGATNPANAEPGTIRKEHAESLEANSVHGSDSLENAEKEISFFFSGLEIVR